MATLELFSSASFSYHFFKKNDKDVNNRLEKSYDLNRSGEAKNGPSFETVRFVSL